MTHFMMYCLLIQLPLLPNNTITQLPPIKSFSLLKSTPPGMKVFYPCKRKPVNNSTNVQNICLDVKIVCFFSKSNSSTSDKTNTENSPFTYKHLSTWLGDNIYPSVPSGWVMIRVIAFWRYMVIYHMQSWSGTPLWQTYRVNPFPFVFVNHE